MLHTNVEGFAGASRGGTASSAETISSAPSPRARCLWEKCPPPSVSLAELLGPLRRATM
jgi:hypothetical protein